MLQAGEGQDRVALPPQQRHKATAIAPREAVKLTEDEREVAVALVADYRSEGVRAPRLATRAEIAERLHVSERTAQRRIDALGRKLKIPRRAQARAPANGRRARAGARALPPARSPSRAAGRASTAATAAARLPTPSFS